MQFLTDKYLAVLLCENFLVNQILDDHSLLLTFWGVDAKKAVHFVGVEVNGLLVVDGTFMHVELVLKDELLGAP